MTHCKMSSSSWGLEANFTDQVRHHSQEEGGALQTNLKSLLLYDNFHDTIQSKYLTWFHDELMILSIPSEPLEGASGTEK